MKTKNKTLPFGHPDTLRNGPFHCRGAFGQSSSLHMSYHPRQAVWMLENKRIYYTGKLTLDIHHLPLELRSL